MAAKIYTDKDASLDELQRRTIAILGFGSHGHAHALNLKDSGMKVIIGLYSGSPSSAVAAEKGFEVFDVAEATRRADLIMFCTPDLKIAPVYEAEVAPHLRKGQGLVFCHGFAIHYKTIVPPKDVDVFMVAFKGPGPTVRRQFVEGKGVPALIAVHQNPTRQARKLALAWAKAVGGTRAGVMETTFKEETETDLFGEQAVLCGGATALVQAGFETLVSAGYQPELAYFECLHELKQITDLMYEAGIAGMRASISETAKFGDVVTGPRIIDRAVRAKMKKVLKEIQDGSFARRWMREYKSGGKSCKKLLAKGEKHPIEKVGARMRGMMPWIAGRNPRGAQATY